MISITIIPALFSLAKISIGDVSVEYDEAADKLTLRGVICTTEEQFDVLDKPALTAEFMDANMNVLCIDQAQLHGRFFELGFCSFSVCVRNISMTVKVEDIAEIRLTPA